MTNLIPLSYLNEVCFLSLNEDDKKYQMALDQAQDTLVEVIGIEWYQELLTQYDADTLSADNDAFYEDSGLKKYLAWQAYFNYLKFANVNATPTGIRTFNDDNSALATDIQMYSLEKNVLSNVNRYKGMMVNYLALAQSKDSTKYPLYRERCRDEYSFGITPIDKESNAMLRINKSMLRNE